MRKDVEERPLFAIERHAKHGLVHCAPMYAGKNAKEHHAVLEFLGRVGWKMIQDDLEGSFTRNDLSTVRGQDPHLVLAMRQPRLLVRQHLFRTSTRMRCVYGRSYSCYWGAETVVDQEFLHASVAAVIQKLVALQAQEFLHSVSCF